ncbi:Electron transfer flavoprotein large subunit (plasmid) [Variovorax sp. SRS16]|uniref:electron transfer flavoprotein subunit alpha/FixB family protein n=1 Tax=Variovorax sp. SRS16 TaxID=282217 RepID=UPI0013170655|nr:electron transfer flavoprotein subunit alpha/FixB family protein [Variovorax sp. SRS16]VTU46440.1 Electron transfer flavoprotein large subunit [Variovorax sp. SRS16]
MSDMEAGSLRIVVLLAGGDAGDGDGQREALIAAARSMLGEPLRGRVELMRLRGVGPASTPALAGLSICWDVTHPGLGADPSAAVWAEAAMQALDRIGIAAPSRTLVLLPSGPLGVELAACLAVRCRGVSLGRCQDLSVEANVVLARKAVFGRRVVAALRSATWPCFAALRPERTKALPTMQVSGELRSITLDGALPADFATQPVDSGDAQRALVGARVVVSGGRGMRGPEGFDLLGRLAAELDAAVGGSLPAVDAGWLPVARQVGQSGKFVAPRTYVAVGISGTPQHLAGVSSESSIIALNSDPDAPIFEMADVGLVGDWQEILPRVLTRLAMRERG